MPLPEKATYPKTPVTLTMENVAVLAVENNPDLILARDDLGIAKAQAFSAGLLPDPQIPFNYAVPYSGPDTSIARGAGLGMDVLPLFTLKMQHQSALAAQRQAELNVLWMEWQAIAQARTLFVQCAANQKMLDVVNHYRGNTQLAYERVYRSLQEGNDTINDTSAQWLVLQNLNGQIITLQQQLNQCQHDLRWVLGLSPRQPFKISQPSVVRFPSEIKINKALQNVHFRRPDLEALQAGYESQELNFRQAIWEQFPAINVQFVQGRDTGQIQSYGFNVTMSLPIFNRNQGNVAIAKATRKRLYDAYQQRIKAANNDVILIIQQNKFLTKTEQQANKRLKNMQYFFKITDIEYQQRNVTLPNYVNVAMSAVDAEFNQITLQQQVLQQKIALEAILGNLS